jgi:hypothetical protein
MVPGIERRKISLGEGGYKDFLRRLEKAVSARGAERL